MFKIYTAKIEGPAKPIYAIVLSDSFSSRFVEIPKEQFEKIAEDKTGRTLWNCFWTDDLQAFGTTISKDDFFAMIFAEGISLQGRKLTSKEFEGVSTQFGDYLVSRGYRKKV